jgi:hypothetical protein
LRISNTTVIGSTVVDNTGGISTPTGGDTLTEIDNSWLQGNGGTGPAFDLDNADGKDIIDVRGNSQFGVGPFPIGSPAVTIDNRDGGSRTTFTGASASAGYGTTTTYGDLSIINGVNVPGTIDIVTFNETNVLGNVAVANGDGDTSTTVSSSTLGSHLVLSGIGPPLIGGPMTVMNGAGFDAFGMFDSSVPWGLSINNRFATIGKVWGSMSTFSDSSIGTHPLGVLPANALEIVGDDGADAPAAGCRLVEKNALEIVGDDGADTFNMTGSSVGGVLDLRLGGGNNDVNLSNNPDSVVGLSLVASGGNDSLVIDNTKIMVSVYVRLGDGVDSMIVRNVDPATQWPSTLLGLVDVSGGAGVDTTNASTLSLGLLGFEVFVL